MPTTSATFPASGENNVPTNASTWAWTNPINIVGSDGNNASLQSNGGAPYVFPYLRASRFGFAITSGATINGIQAVIHTGVGNTDYSLDEVRLAYGTAAQSYGDNRTPGGTFHPNSTINCGSDADLWGISLTPSIVNNDEFGLILLPGRASGSLTRTIPVNYITLAITYTDPSSGGGGGSTAIARAFPSANNIRFFPLTSNRDFPK